MCSANEIKIVSIQEFADDISPKREADTTVVLAPTMNVLVGVRPEEVAE